jgi:capsule polysaccharide export protein KpsE/RkpR
MYPVPSQPEGETMAPDHQPAMAPGLNLNPDILQQVMQSQIADQSVQITQLTSAVQQLIMEKAAIQRQLDAALAELEKETEDADSEQ